MKKFSRDIFDKRANEFIESISKILQFHGNENIIRAIVHIFKVNINTNSQ